jgi:hypothetical protein
MPTAEAEHCFPVELLEQLKEQIPQALFAALSDRVATYEEQLGAASKQLDTTRSELQYARLKIQVLGVCPRNRVQAESSYRCRPDPQ